MKINLFDSNGITNSPIDGICKAYKYIEYISNLCDFNGITIFTDHYILNNTAKIVNSKIKIGWLVEPKVICNETYKYIISQLCNYDYVMTHDVHLLNSNNKFIFCPVGECWISEQNKKMHNKIKNISFIFSNKASTEGQILRHDIYRNFKNKIDSFGNAISYLKLKDYALIDYRFSICVENNSVENYFTEKIIDCFMTGTIPIYCGCKNIGDYFNMNGIIYFNSLKELNDILDNVDEEYYNSKLEFVKENFELAKKYCVMEDWIYENILVNIKC